MMACEARLFQDSRLTKWLYLTCFAICCLGVQGITFEKIVTRARCIANCYTLHAVYNHDSEKTCQSAACTECLSPCGKVLFGQSESKCLQSCMNSSSCEASCRFLEQLKNFSSIFVGDGSRLPRLGIPTVTNKNLTSLSLQWDPVQNASGTSVYLVAMEITGDYDLPSPFYFVRVFTNPRATLGTEVDLCALVKPLLRRKFKGLFYTFKVAVLTENSSISYGSKTKKISLPQPAPVSNLALASLVYDSSQSENNRLKLTASWTRSEQQEVIKNHVMVWKQECISESDNIPRVHRTKSTDPTGSMKLDEKIRKCNHTLKVYAMSQCIQSNATVITYEYPGCANITSYPTELCYKFDPPYSPDEYREVRNLSYSLISIDDGYKFRMNVTWNRPLYHYKPVEYYYILWKRSHEKFYFNAEIPVKTSQEISLLPAEKYDVKVIPYFQDGKPAGSEQLISISSPAVDPAEVTVRNLALDDFSFSPQTGKFDLNVTWQKPSFNYSRILSYSLAYQVNEGSKNFINTSKTYFIIYGILHGQPVTCSVTPRYINNRIQGVRTYENTNAPVPPDSELTVQHLTEPEGKFVEDEQSNTFAVNFTWDPPSFKYKGVLYYNVSYQFSGYARDQFQSYTKTSTKETTFLVSGIFPREHVSIEVTPVYNDKYITGKMKITGDMAPSPKVELVKVVGLKHNGLVPSSQGSFRTTVSWQKPLFDHSAVQHYSYRISNTSVKGTDRKIRRRAIDFNTDFTTVYTNVTIDGIKLDKKIEFKVTPVFVVHVVTGQEDAISILKTNTPSPQVSRAMAPSEIIGLIIGSLVFIVIVLCLVIWCHRERQKRLKAHGLVQGKNALMIDHWEVDGNLVTLEEEIDEGAFGKVFKGTLKEHCTPSQKLSLNSTFKASRITTIKGNEVSMVAVKMLHNMGDSDQRKEFLDEIQLMKGVGSHRNIVNMVGCCTIQEPMFLLLEYVPCGSLLHYLRKHRGKIKGNLADTPRGPYRSTYCETYCTDASPTGISVKATKSDRIYFNVPELQQEENGNIQLVSFSSHKSAENTGEENIGLNTDENEKEPDENEEDLTPGDLMAFAWQISQGMEYLAKKGFIHRDLAARNVLVGEKKIAKVADFGLTRHVYEEKVYQAKTNRKLPLKWMSIEAIFLQTFTVQSDVWAFGVVLWELVTLGGTPYPTIDNKELLRVLKDGYRMEKPDTCNDEMYDLMMDCWKENPDGRPNFTQLRERLEVMMQKDNPYLDLSAVDEKREYYNVPSFNSIMEESPGDDVFDDVTRERRRSSAGPVELTDQQPAGQSNGNNTEILKQTEDKNNIELAGYHDSCSKINGPKENLKDIKIDFDELQMSLCRPARRGIAF